MPTYPVFGFQRNADKNDHQQGQPPMFHTKNSRPVLVVLQESVAKQVYLYTWIPRAVSNPDMI